MPIFEWYVIRCGSKRSKNYDQNIWLKEITLRAQNMLIILGSIINMSLFIYWGRGGGRGLFDHLLATTIFTLTMNDEANGYGHNLDMLFILH